MSGWIPINDEVIALEVAMSEQDLEVLVTLDDPGEDDLEEDTFHNRQNENPSNASNKEATRPANR
jgi:hypothetical protein